jgi:hypothetical protein
MGMRMVPHDVVRAVAWLAVGILAGLTVAALILAGSVDERGTTQLTNWLAYGVMVLSGAASYLLFRRLTHAQRLSPPLGAPHHPMDRQLSDR